MSSASSNRSSSNAATSYRFEDGLTTAEHNDLLGNPSGRRAKTITTDAVAYGRIVVTTYCPAELANYQKAVDHLDPVESDQ